MPAVAFTIEPPRLKWVITMDTERISSLSLEQVRFPVSADSNGTIYNPTADPVAMAFMTSPNTNPAAGDWKIGGWDSTAIGTYVATCLVGPAGAATLVPGTYYCWVRITDNPEIPVREAGTLVVD